MQNIDRELGWDDTIQNDGEEFVLLPEGVYAFQVVKMERARFAGSAKLPPCNQANVTIQVEHPETGMGRTIEEKLKLHSKMEWELCAFFRSLGLRKEGEPLQMRWGEIVGKTGWVQLEVRTYRTQNNEERQINSVKKWLPPEAAPGMVAAQQATATFTPGEF